MKYDIGLNVLTRGGLGAGNSVLLEANRENFKHILKPCGLSKVLCKLGSLNSTGTLIGNK